MGTAASRTGVWSMCEPIPIPRSPVNISPTFVVFRSHSFDRACEGIMEKTKASECFRKCLPPCPRFLTPEDTPDLCIMCLGEERARLVLEVFEYTHCDKLWIRKLPSHLSLFSRDEGQVSVSRSSGSAAAEAQHNLRLWGLKVKLAMAMEMKVWALSLPNLAPVPHTGKGLR